MTKKATIADAVDWSSLYRTGAVAALLAGLLFRRNLGIEISLFAAQKPPDNPADWFALLQTNRLLGLAYLHIFDVVNYLLVGLMFLALYVLLRRAGPGRMSVAAVLGLLGIGAYLASNTAFSMLTLSEQYAAAGAPQRAALLSAGDALLAINRFTSPGAHPGSGGYLNLLLVAAASLLISLVMLRSGVFPRAAAMVGIAASVLDLIYCLLYALAPGVDRQLLAVSLIPAAGPLYMVWHILVGWRLLRIARQKGS